MAACALVFALPERLTATPARIAASATRANRRHFESRIPTATARSAAFVVCSLGSDHDGLTLGYVLRGAVVVYVQRAFLGSDNQGAIQHGNLTKRLEARPGCDGNLAGFHAQGSSFGGVEHGNVALASKTVTSVGIPQERGDRVTAEDHAAIIANRDNGYAVSHL